MLQVHEAMVRRIVSELRDRDNLYYEICNEPYIHGVSPEWQAHIAKVIVETERGWPQRRHLIAQNIGNRSSRVQNPDSNVSVLNFHYSRPPDSVRLNRDLNRAVGNNETGFDGVSDAVYRIQGWEFLLAGGALYNSLDYSFAAGKEDGTFRYPPSHWGGGSPELRRQLGFLRRFMDSLDLVNLAPAREIIKGGPGNGVSAYVLTKRGAQYAVYLHRGSPVAKSDVPPGAARYTVSQAAERDTIVLELPPGSYSGEWMDTKSGKSTPLRFRHAQGNRKLESPVYKEDIALRLTRAAGRTR
jgi:hypothetical protein